MTRESFFKYLVAGAASVFFLRKTSVLSAQAQVPAAISPDFPPFVAPEGPNKPFGTPKGIVPGRVAWAYDPKAVLWDGVNGFWWDDSVNDQARIDTMFSKTLKCVANDNNEEKAWKAVFAYFNQSHGKQNLAYTKGEKIALKVNMNNDRSGYTDTPWVNSSPHLVNSIIGSLVNKAGVLEEDIIVYDATRYFTPHFYNTIHNAFPKVVLVDGYGGMEGRVKNTWTPNCINYAVKTLTGTAIATCAVESSYIINVYIAKGHGSTGVTLSGKNHYGSINNREHNFIDVKNKGYDSYNPLVEIMGHKHLGGKTLLNVCDMLYGCYHSDPAPIKWKMAPFNDAWPSSLLVSLDPIANDSVALDFLTTEFCSRTDIPVGVNKQGKKVDMTHCDALLHQTANANNPPMGIVYAPNGDGVPMKSLGVHEHWNNPKDKKYSKNLGRDYGIELILLNN